jgi:hypothetical protein
MTPQLGPTPDQIASMRTAVMERIAPQDDAVPRQLAAPQRQKSRRPAARRFGLVAVGVGAVAAALIVTGVIVPSGGGGSGGATAQAAGFLKSAALATIATSDPVVGPGQFLRIETLQVSAPSDGTREAPMYLSPATSVLYIPEDRSDTWVWERHNLPSIGYFNAAGKAAAERSDADPDRFSDSDLNGVLREKAGAFYGSPPQAEQGFEELSRDPATLREYFYAEYQGGSSSIDEDVWVRITDLLVYEQVPADLRAALYRTLALLPGVTIVEDDATLDGRSGVALGYTEPARGSMWRDEIIIDPTDGRVIGTREVTLNDYDDIPPGTTLSWSTVQTSVVDNAP